MNQSEQINELAKALCEAQKEALFALTDSENPFFKSKYADLSAVWNVARKPLTDNGLSIAQTMDYEGGDPVIVTTLMHTSGQWIRGRLLIKPKKQDDPQQLGSAITYGRRYSLSAILGICPEDDDGEKAMSRNDKPEKKAPKKQEPEVTFDSLCGTSIVGAEKEEFTTYLREFRNASKATVLTHFGTLYKDFRTWTTEQGLT